MVSTVAQGPGYQVSLMVACIVLVSLAFVVQAIITGMPPLLARRMRLATQGRCGQSLDAGDMALRDAYR